MAMIIPDIVLESCVCSLCNKFLSVQPVKIYPNQNIKCGRCSRKDDNGTESLYNIIAATGIFKCINRFDGCRKMLRHYEVLDHEKECRSILVRCPVCPRLRKVKILRMIFHFEKCHNINYLKKPSFKLNRDKTENSFLFRKDDNLFFISYKIQDNGDVFLEGWNTNQSNVESMSFCLLTKSSTVEAEKLNLKDHKNEFIIKNKDIPSRNMDMKIKFEIKMLPNFFILANSSRQTMEAENNVKRILDNFQRFTKFYYSQHITFPRKITMTFGTHNDTEFSISHDRNYIIKKCGSEMYNIFLECCYCVNILLPPTTLLDGFFIKIGNHFFNICNNCFQYLCSKNQIITYVSFQSVLENLNNFFFDCSWDCHKKFRLNQLHVHKRFIICPIDSCMYFNDSTSIGDFGNHFKTVHSLTMSTNGYFISLINFNSITWLYLFPYFVELISCKPSTENITLLMIVHCKVPNVHVKGIVFNEQKKVVGELEENNVLKLVVNSLTKIKCHFGFYYVE